MKYKFTFLLLIFFSTISSAQLRFSKKEKRMIKCVTRYEKERLKWKYRREDGLIVLVFSNTKYVISSGYVDDLYFRKGKEWIKFE